MIISNQMSRMDQAALKSKPQICEMRPFMEDYTFDAFISYSHRDLGWGTWLQKNRDLSDPEGYEGGQAERPGAARFQGSD